MATDRFRATIESRDSRAMTNYYSISVSLQNAKSAVVRMKAYPVTYGEVGNQCRRLVIPAKVGIQQKERYKSDSQVKSPVDVVELIFDQ